MAGDGTLSSAKMVVGGAEGQYTVAKTSVWWDIENCHVPKGFDAHGIAQNISSALVKMNYCGPVSISAYGDTNKIPPAVQQALNSTGISLNHVPAGVKDASDKKILVDMLFWAVDNPAPANYLLISGDRDFSNALHQLRMRRYNVLLAQPLKASTALVAAAKSVWCWTSLLAGGSPLTSGESSQLANSNNTFNPEILRDPVPDIFPKNQAAYSKSESISLRNQNFFIPVEVGDAKDKGKYVLKNPNQPGITKASSMPVAIHESNYFTNINQPESAQAKQFKRAPHEFFGTTEPFLASRSDHLGLGNIGNFNIKDDLHKQYTQPQPVFAPDGLSRLDSYNNAFRPVAQKHDGPRFSSAPLTNVPNIGKLGMSEESNYFRNPPNFYREVGGDYKPKSMESPNLARPCVPQKGDISHTSQPVSHDILGNRNPHVFDVPEVSSFSHITISTNSIHGVQCQPPPEYIQGLIGVILLALNSLKLEKLMPTETNIKDCIRYGDPKFRNTDVKKALECALEHKMILKQNLGAVWLYVGRMERLWKCVNPIGGNQNQYSKATWDAIQEFLTSSDGRSAIMASECRYEAALILKNACLKYLALGEVLQILNMIIDVKRWITHPQLGWQPITVTLAESKSDAGTDTDA